MTATRQWESRPDAAWADELRELRDSVCSETDPWHDTTVAVPAERGPDDSLDVIDSPARPDSE